MNLLNNTAINIVILNIVIIAILAIYKLVIARKRKNQQQKTYDNNAPLNRKELTEEDAKFIQSCINYGSDFANTRKSAHDD